MLSPNPANSPTGGGDNVPETISVRSEEGVDIESLFGEIDWANVNLGEIEQQWRKELETIEQENAQALVESANKIKSILPALSRAQQEVHAVDGLLADYCSQLQIMGHEIQQIEELNRGLNIQTANQAKLLKELDSILEKISLPDEVVRILESEALDNPACIKRVANAAGNLQQVVSARFEEGLGTIRAVSERIDHYTRIHRRFVSKLADFFEGTFVQYRERVLDPKRSARRPHNLCADEEMAMFLDHYTTLVTVLREMDPRLHAHVLKAYQEEMSTVFRKELQDLLENIKTARLIRRPAEDKNYLFISLTTSMQDRAANLINIVQQRAAIASDRDFATVPPFDPAAFPELETNEIINPEQAMHYIILAVALQVARQQALCARAFFAAKTEEAPDEHTLKLVDSMLMAIFEPFAELINMFIEFITRIDTSTAVEMLVALDLRIPQLSAELPFFAKMLQNVKRRLLTITDQFIEEQITVIDSMKFSARKRSGVFPFVSLFPTFITRMERVVGAAEPGSSARDAMNRGYEKITAAIFRSLDALNMEAERTDDEKERINASVMNIQNGHYLVMQLRAIKSSAIEASLKLAKARYDHHLALYSSLSIQRVFGKLLDFFEAISNMLETTPPEEVAFHASFNKASARRIISAYPVREIRKNLETLYKRVEKHFSTESSLLQVVWRAVQEEFLKDSTMFADCIQKVYAGGDLQLGYSVGDAIACFSEIAKSQ